MKSISSTIPIIIDIPISCQCIIEFCLIKHITGIVGVLWPDPYGPCLISGHQTLSFLDAIAVVDLAALSFRYGELSYFFLFNQNLISRKSVTCLNFRIWFVCLFWFQISPQLLEFSCSGNHGDIYICRMATSFSLDCNSWITYNGIFQSLNTLMFLITRSVDTGRH